MKKLLINLSLLILIPGMLIAQNPVINSEKVSTGFVKSGSEKYKDCNLLNYGERGNLDYLLMSKSEWCLAQAIYEMNKRQSAVSYNVANASTPGFKPIRFPDEIENAINLYGDTSLLNQVHLDDEMVKATHIRLKHTAYIRLLTTKMQITRKVVTLNKGG